MDFWGYVAAIAAVAGTFIALMTAITFMGL